MSIAQTLVRIMQRAGLMRPVLSPNLLVNPLFEHIESETGSSGVITLPTAFAKTFACAPGWYDFGGITEGTVDSSPTPTVGAVPTAFARAGVEITQTQFKKKGLCQKIFRGSIVRGRRLRISGRYRIPTGGTPDSLTGVSIWLKSDKQLASATPAEYGEIVWTSQGNTLPVSRKNYVKFPTAEIYHAIRMTNFSVGSGYADGEELLVRSFDWWGYGAGDRTSGDALLSTDGYIAFGGATAEPGVLDTPSVRLHYLDGTFDGIPANGTKELYTEAQASAGVYSFETFVDVDDVAGLFEDNEVWLVVMPVDPNSVASMATGDAVTILQHLSVEVVLDSDSTDDQLLGAALSQSARLPYGHGFGGSSLRELLQYPIYVGALYKLNTLPMVGGSGSTLQFVDFKIEDTPDTLYYTFFDTGWTDGDSYFSIQPSVLPPGSSILAASLSATAVGGTDSMADAKLLQVLSNDPNGDGGERRLIVGEWATINTNASYSAAIRRNRLGMYWGDNGNNFDSETYLGQGAAHLVFKATVTVDDGFGVEGNFIYAVVDPRLAYGQWRRS